jgi:hypothetical protein
MVMRKLGAVLLMVVAVASYADKQKPSKSKDKRFEAVSVQASAATGSYRGPAESYGLVLELGDDGTLRGNYVEMGHVAVLNAIVVDGAAFTAHASFDDGSSRTITGSFANRVRNGTTTFGLRMHAVPVEGMGLVDTFFERF